MASTKQSLSSAKPLRRPRVSTRKASDRAGLGIGSLATTKKVRVPRQPKVEVYKKPVHPKATMTFRHNVLPPVLGILMMLGILGLLNAQWIIAQVQYRFITPPPIAITVASVNVIDPNAPPKIVIPKINLSAPIIIDEKSYEEDKVQLALRNGVVQYGTSANPGQKGNTVIVGHSSGQLWAPGDYKFVFTLLDKLVKNDRILIDYKGVQYVYRVEDSKVVIPSNVSVVQPTDDPRLTLITCTPVGTNKNRLVITARQVSPKPETATPLSPEQMKPITTRAVPGNT